MRSASTCRCSVPPSCSTARARSSSTLALEVSGGVGRHRTALRRRRIRPRHGAATRTQPQRASGRRERDVRVLRQPAGNDADRARRRHPGGAAAVQTGRPRLRRLRTSRRIDAGRPRPALVDRSRSRPACSASIPTDRVTLTDESARDRTRRRLDDDRAGRTRRLGRTARRVVRDAAPRPLARHVLITRACSPAPRRRSSAGADDVQASTAERGSCDTSCGPSSLVHAAISSEMPSGSLK